LAGYKKASGQALQFPRAFSALNDTNGTTFAQKAQVYDAIALAIGNERQMDRRVIEENMNGYSRMSTFSLLASVEAENLLDNAGYISNDSPAQGRGMRSSRSQSTLKRIKL